jgi:hypothetical protein
MMSNQSKFGQKGWVQSVNSSVGRKFLYEIHPWETMQKVERKAQMQDAKLESICSRRMGAERKFQA